MPRKLKNPKFGTRYSLVAREDCDQVIPIANATKRTMFGFRGGYIRNLGVALVDWKYGPGRPPVIAVYGHTQITNSEHYTAWPAMGMLLDKEAAEQLLTMLLTALSKYDA